MIGAALDGGTLSGAEALALLITAVSTFVTAVGGFVLVMRRQQATHDTVEKVYEHVNSVEDELAVPGARAQTLGQAVRQMRAEVREGTERLDRIERALDITDDQ